MGCAQLSSTSTDTVVGQRVKLLLAVKGFRYVCLTSCRICWAPLQGYLTLGTSAADFVQVEEGAGMANSLASAITPSRESAGVMALASEYAILSSFSTCGDQLQM